LQIKRATLGRIIGIEELFVLLRYSEGKRGKRSGTSVIVLEGTPPGTLSIFKTL
jgi:hypothetical protein